MSYVFEFIRMKGSANSLKLFLWGGGGASYKSLGTSGPHQRFYAGCTSWLNSSLCTMQPVEAKSERFERLFLISPRSSSHEIMQGFSKKCKSWPKNFSAVAEAEALLRWHKGPTMHTTPVRRFSVHILGQRFSSFYSKRPPPPGRFHELHSPLHRHKFK
jgi:hypothetical protein